MTRPLAIAAVAVAVYDFVAYRTGRAPTITHGVHQAYRHFVPHCRGCTCDVVRPLVPRQPRYRGWHTARPS